jgi:hypothetical protein
MSTTLGDVLRFLDHAMRIQGMFWKFEYFRNALDTAVACDHRDMVHAILTYILIQLETDVKLLESLGAQVEAVVIPLPSQRSKSGTHDDQRSIFGQLRAVFWGCVVWMFRVLS